MPWIVPAYCSTTFFLAIPTSGPTDLHHSASPQPTLVRVGIWVGNFRSFRFISAINCLGDQFWSAPWHHNLRGASASGGQDARCTGCGGESVIGAPELGDASATIGGLAMARSVRRAS